MLMCTSWKSRPLSPEQTDRMMSIWGKIEADQAANASVERVCWFMNADGGGGFTVNRAVDPDAATALGLEFALSLGEFLEVDTRPVLDLNEAMPAITNALGRIKG
jgi:hypothetical protein